MDIGLSIGWWFGWRTV